MKNPKLFYLITLLLFSSSIFSQITVKGSVLDEGGFPLPGATILEEGAKNGTVTNYDGEFVLETKDDTGKLIISFIGYENQVLLFSPTIDEFKNIQLSLSNKLISEVVIVGYNQKELKDVTESVANVTQVKELDTRPIVNAFEILQGTVSGVTVLNDGGDPTKMPSVTIRGITSLSSETPLIVVDGVPELPMPNPSDIESITVLKDASASIYGARATGGVIIVKTKGGDRKKTTVSFNTYLGYQSVANQLNPLNTTDYINLSLKMLENDNVASNDTRYLYFQDLKAKDKRGELPNNRWLDLIFRDGLIQNYDLGVKSGGDFSKVYFGVNHRKTEGTLLNSYFDRTTFRINSEFDIKKNTLTIGENLAVNYTNGNYGINTTNPYDGLIFAGIHTRSFHPVYNNDGTYSEGDLDLRDNPVADLRDQDAKNPTINIAGNAFVKYKFFNDFTFKTSLGVNKTLSNYREFKTPDKKDARVSLARESVDYFSWIVENNIAYNKDFNEHSLDILLGHSAQRNQGSYFGAKANNFPLVDPKLNYLDLEVSPDDRQLSGAPLVNNSLVSYVGRVDYSYANKYYLTGIVRRDGSSKLGPNNRWGTFPSLSAAWRVGQESFMSDLDWLSELKIRGSYGRLGNVGALGDFDYKTDIVTGGSFMLINNEWVDGIKFIKPANPDLRWEESVQTNIGLDANFLDSSLYLTFDYFIKKTENMLIQIPSAAQLGYEQPPFTNSGTVENRGFELLVGYKKKEENFGYNISANASLIDNKVLDLADRQFISHNDEVRGLENFIRTEVGRPLRSFYVIETDGIFQTQEEVNAHTDYSGNIIQPNARPGDLKFKDIDGDGKITADDRVFKGNMFPDVSFGLNLAANYKGFDFSMFWQGTLGNKIFNGLKHTAYSVSQGYNALDAAKQYWSEENTGASIPRLTSDDTNGNYSTVSDWYLEDASYAKLKNITLSYTLPSEFFRDKFNVKMYITGKDLLTITKYTGFDPEIQGIDVGYYPTARSFIFGTRVEF